MEWRGAEGDGGDILNKVGRETYVCNNECSEIKCAIAILLPCVVYFIFMSELSNCCIYPFIIII